MDTKGYLPVGGVSSHFGGDKRQPASHRIYAGIYHLAARGSDIRHLFLSNRDREEFLERLAAVWEHFELALVSYVLMGSHYLVENPLDWPEQRTGPRGTRAAPHPTRRGRPPRRLWRHQRLA